MRKKDDMDPVAAFLALGANLGEPLEQLRGARKALEERLIRVTAASPLYETLAVGGPPDQPPYLNAVLRVETRLFCRDLLNACRAIEDLFGRRRGELWGPRTLDIDLLFYDGEIIEEPGLVVPHPRLHLRRFVLAPLNDLDPEWRHPLLGRSVRQLLAALGDREPVRLCSQEW